VRTVRGAALLEVAMAGAALLLPGQEQGHGCPLTTEWVWFGLPLVLTLGGLAIARMEIHPWDSWASPTGQRPPRRAARTVTYWRRSPYEGSAPPMIRRCGPRSRASRAAHRGPHL
jgi:hypothetical protein